MNIHKKKKDMLATGKGFRSLHTLPPAPVVPQNLGRPEVDVKATVEEAFKKARTDLKLKQLQKAAQKNKV